MAPGGDTLSIEGSPASVARCWQLGLTALLGAARLSRRRRIQDARRFPLCVSNGAPRSISSAPRSAPSRRSHPRSRLSGQRRLPAVRSALDAGAGATQRRDVADLPRHRPQPGAGAAAVRHCGISRRPPERRAGEPLAVALSSRFSPRRPVRCRSSRLRRGVFAGARRRRRHAAADICEDRSKCRSPARS